MAARESLVDPFGRAVSNGQCAERRSRPCHGSGADRDHDPSQGNKARSKSKKRQRSYMGGLAAPRRCGRL